MHTHVHLQGCGTAQSEVPALGWGGEQGEDGHLISVPCSVALCFGVYQRFLGTNRPQPRCDSWQIGFAPPSPQ